MTNDKRNRIIHLVGLLLCLAALALSIGPANAKTLIALAVAAVGIAGNAYGVFHPLNFFADRAQKDGHA